MNMRKPFSLSVKVVIMDSKGRCLVLRRSASSKANAGKWDFPGGKVDPGETFDQGLLREVSEETGIDIFLSRVAGAGESELPERNVAYLFMEAVADSTQVHLSAEHDDFAWVPVKDLRKIDLAPQYMAIAESYSKESCTNPLPSSL